jgi:hypothetical protein
MEVDDVALAVFTEMVAYNLTRAHSYGSSPSSALAEEKLAYAAYSCADAFMRVRKARPIETGLG